MIYKKKQLVVAISTAITLNMAAGPVIASVLEEVIVTATKRTESMQDIPVSVQALGGDSLRELGIETFDRYVDYLPNVVSAGNGPGKKEIYIRGSATEQSSVNLGSAQGTAAGVALYLDEQPVSFGSRNLDIYAADLERIEVLAGPQGTLFGASSQSGTVRLISRRPLQGEFEAGFNTKLAATKGGDNSAAVDGYINIPLTNSLAFRAVIYTDHQGGWIDNTAATYTPNGLTVDRVAICCGPTLTGAEIVDSANNVAIVEDNWNAATYTGGRFGLAFDINDNWDVLLQHTEQTLEVDGTFLTDPSLGDEITESFSPETNKDDFGLTSWTLNGRLENLDLIYTGGYLSRDVDSVIDYTHYNAGGGYITYYMCAGPYRQPATHCYDPGKQFIETASNKRTTHEFRIATDPAKRWRALGGIYYNDFETKTLGEFQYAGTNPAFADMQGDPTFLMGQTSIDTPGSTTLTPLDPATTFSNDFTRKEDEIAFFGEFAFDITDNLTFSLSARNYSLTTQLQGSSNSAFGCRFGIGADSELTVDGRCNGIGFSNDVSERLRLLGDANATGNFDDILAATTGNPDRDFFFGGGGSNQALVDAILAGEFDISNLQKDGSTKESDTIFKATIDWYATDEVLLFATFSEGYRPATQNRNAGRLAANPNGSPVFNGYRVPAVALTDTLTNYEIGIKSSWLEGSLRVNATLYRSELENLQVSRFDPTNVAFLVFVENVGDADITGLDIDFQWAATGNWLISGAVGFLDTELTRITPQLQGIAVPVGSDLPLSSDFSGNLRARYDFPLDSFSANAYVQAGIVYRGKNVSGITGSAAFIEDTLYQDTGRSSGLELQLEGGDYGTILLPDGTLPPNARFINPSALTLNLSTGVFRDNWNFELFLDNVTDEAASIVQVAGRYLPEVTNQRPRTGGIRFSYYY